MSEELKWLLTIAVFPALWAIGKMVQTLVIPYLQRERELSSASLRERDQSIRVHLQTEESRSQIHRDHTEDKVVDFWLSNSDGRLTAIENSVDHLSEEIIKLREAIFKVFEIKELPEPKTTKGGEDEERTFNLGDN